MKVIANKRGFYGGLQREAGAFFDVADGETAKWFEPVKPGNVSADKPAIEQKVAAPKGQKLSSADLLKH